MPAIVKNKFRLRNARDFIENFSSSEHSTSRNHYLFIGKPTVWGAGAVNEELSPPLPADTYEEENRIWDEMLGLKKIDEQSVSLVIPRSDWDVNGQTVYAIYDDKDTNLYSQPTPTRSNELAPNIAGNFYVMTDTFDIFVCLENGLNSVSTEKPVRQNPATSLIDYSAIDGYVWKYIGSVTASDATRFATDAWIPVQVLESDDGSFQWDVQQAAVGGEVVSVVIDSVGSGYTNTYSGGFVAGTLDNSTGVGVAQLSGSPSATNDYYAGGQIHIISGPDAGSIYTIDSYNGTTGTVTLMEEFVEDTGVIVADQTSVIQILPQLNITTNGTAVNLRPVLDNGEFSRVLLIDAGQDATYIKIDVVNSLGGTGAIIRAVLSDVDGLGADIEKDLGATYVMLNSKLEYDEGQGDFPQNNDYRQLGIIRDAKNPDGSLATATTLIATKKLNLTNVSGDALTYDEIVEVTSAVRGVALQYIESTVTPGTGVLTYIQNPSTGYGTFTAGATITGTNSQNPFTATINTIEDEEIKKLDGVILYIENRRAVLRSEDQIEDIKAIIQF